MKKINVYLDMDGTIADLYGQPNWLERLRTESLSVFSNASPMITEEALLKAIDTNYYNIIILSMTPKGASDEYCEAVKEVKRVWLSVYFPSLTKQIYLKYGHNKNLKNSKNAILIDDNEIIRQNFRGLAIEPFWL